jgi:hypothetical protein
MNTTASKRKKSSTSPSPPRLHKRPATAASRSTIWESSKPILHNVKESEDAFGPLKSTANTLLDLIHLFEVGS